MTRTTTGLGGITLDRPLQTGFSYVPVEIEVVDNAVVWSADCKSVRYGVGLLTDFVELYDSSDDEIVRYARQWGVLGICKHGLPASHNHYPFGVQEGVRGCTPLKSDRGEFWHRDPIDGWRDISRKLKAALDIGAQLNQENPGTEDDWSVIVDIDMDDPPWRSVHKARTRLSWYLDQLLSLGQVRPDVRWDAGRVQWQLRLAAHSVPNLFGLVSLSLVQSICRRDLVICSSCCKAYTPPRRPNQSRRNYCENCGLSEAQKDASREYRRRKREKDKHRADSGSKKKPNAPT
jgi:hypothetical protein